LLGFIGNIGSNLNQIAKVGNSGDGVDVIDLNRELRYLHEARDALLKALGREP